MGLANGDILRVTWRGNLFGSEVRTVFHYQCSTTGSSDSVETDLDRVGVTLYSPLTHPFFASLQAATSQDFQWTGLDVQRVSPVRTIAIHQTSIVNGTFLEPAMPTNVNVTITKQTITPGRRGIGSAHFCGVTRDDIFEAQLTPAGLVRWSGVAAQMLSGVTIPAANNLLIVPGLYHGSSFQFPFSRLFDSQAQDSTRIMYRRTLRVGI